MTFDEMLGQLIVMSHEQRAQSDDYCEVVVSQTKLESALQAMESYFGLPLKPSGQPVTDEVKNYAEPYGGIGANQTMYYKKSESGTEMALLWPWGSGDAVTFKLIRGA